MSDSTAMLQAKSLSTATMAVLIFRTGIAETDLGRSDFVAFIQRMETMNNGPLFKDWREAWDGFCKTGGVYNAMLRPTPTE